MRHVWGNGGTVASLCSHQRKHAPTCFNSAKVFLPPQSVVVWRLGGWPLVRSFHLKQLHGSISHLLYMIQFMKVCRAGYNFWFLALGGEAGILQECFGQNLDGFFYEPQMDGWQSVYVCCTCRIIGKGNIVWRLFSWGFYCWPLPPFFCSFFSVCVTCQTPLLVLLSN